MEKTLRNKLTEQHTQTLTSSLKRANPGVPSVPAVMSYSVDLQDDRNILNEVAKDLLQPRPEALSRILAMAKDL